MSGTHPLVRVETLLLIAVGGFAGSNLRYFIELIVPSTLGATFLVNVLGSFALAVILYEASTIGALSDRSKFVFGTGFLSSFTTFSTFVFDVISVDPVVGLAYVLASYASGFAAVLLGRVFVTRAIVPRVEVA
ncbi:fluoride efflux transporter FluC [Natranaeroarchaeum sulfidigenes]|uniref:Fluoride-specific ion channel FluC n=1 Tax=Natranaeroarchaeum sulfidigenes TaxID=2784880 RepID=A0A897MWE2_9EURY|nr:CrcB family protein [Natranaeroarchaeum sulfidigenes]QSG02625.1 Integral membrane protein [Natranaeroarchaeum sulfidigenes]